MRLSILLQDFYALPAEADREISALTLDSRAVKPDSLFIAIKGTHQDGRDYIPQAIANGASAIVIDAENAAISTTVPVIAIPQLQKNLAAIAARFYDYPARKLRMIGITGTSGKTSCSHYLACALESLQIRCGIIGTLGSGFYDALGTAGLTTPDAISLQALLHDFVKQGAQAVAMEVSSHSIDQGRVNHIDYDIGIFTNLSQDHLDYHGDMPSYAAVKRRFFADMSVKHLIINTDDVYGATWINELAASKSILAYGTKKPAVDVPFIQAKQVVSDMHGITAQVISPFGEAKICLPLIGEFNLGNGLAVLAALCAYGIPFQEAVTSLATLQPVAGRMQTLGGGKHPLIVVDYAHKPDALEKVLQALRSHTRGKLWCVFGCGGERDRGKRPLMAKIAERLADHVIVTNDNPRHEKPEEIAAEIMQGFVCPEKITVELDRSKAILNSIQCASQGDCILIAGKGAERYQQVGDEKIPFDDVEKAKKYLGENKCYCG